jgi:hypothetical protein
MTIVQNLYVLSVNHMSTVQILKTIMLRSTPGTDQCPLFNAHSEILIQPARLVQIPHILYYGMCHNPDTLWQEDNGKHPDRLFIPRSKNSWPLFPKQNVYKKDLEFGK